ncbi:MAG: RrF2 family transcriptional regulator [Clostridia bacterium]|nr:RrF2 family transcriptional regulator [Clostridia bacterium]
MKISTRGRYAVRVLIDMAENFKGDYIPLKDIVKRQEVSQKYLEGIMLLLSKNDIVEGVHGKGGGYRLKKPPEDITIGEILRATEGSLAPVSCLEENAKACERAGSCKTLPMWREFSALVNGFFDGKTIKDLTGNTGGGEYII